MSDMTAKKPIPLVPGWDEHRWKQLFSLETLLNEVTMINSGSHCLERIQKCIALAEELRSDPAMLRMSLPSFLKEKALGREAS